MEHLESCQRFWSNLPLNITIHCMVNEHHCTVVEQPLTINNLICEIINFKFSLTQVSFFEAWWPDLWLSELWAKNLQRDRKFQLQPISDAKICIEFFLCRTLKKSKDLSCQMTSDSSELWNKIIHMLLGYLICCGAFPHTLSFGWERTWMMLKIIIFFGWQAHVTPQHGHSLCIKLWAAGIQLQIEMLEHP